MTDTQAAASPIISVQGLQKYFAVGRASMFRTRPVLKAVDGIDFSIGPGETLGLVGESGCGKTTTARLLLGLEEPSGGEILFDGKPLAALPRAEWKAYRKSVQAVFQDPQSSLSPRMNIGDIIAEPLIATGAMTRAQARERVAEVLHWVELPADCTKLYPHEFSGGQRQRIAIARALAVHARLIVLDEPVASLDTSIRSQIVNLLKDLQERLGLSYILISHDLATSRYLCDRIAVMYLGRIVESGPCDELFDNPMHPYTRALLSAAMPLHPDDRVDEILLSGEVPSPIAPPPGCTFHTRCPQAMNVCRGERPLVREERPGHFAGCHLYANGQDAPAS